MTRPTQSWTRSRHIAERIVVEGKLVLLTPAHFGSGDAEGVVDLTLLRDPSDGAALLPGASIAGALRNYWRERKGGYGAASQDSELFGARRGARDEMEGDQSLLIVEDSIAREDLQVELRDGVAIDTVTRTAARGKLFNMEVLRAGTCFPLRFELLIDERPPDHVTWADYERRPQAERDLRLAARRQELCQDLALALQGFEDQEIGLGARKSRGFGRCQVKQWHVRCYDLLQDKSLFACLSEGQTGTDTTLVAEETGDSLSTKLGVPPLAIDRRQRFEIKATFSLESSLLVRSGADQVVPGADMEHLHRTWYHRKGDPEAGKQAPVLPGTSLAGALRARAMRIVKTLSDDQVRTTRLVDELFGVGPADDDSSSAQEKQHWASRLVAHESTVDGVHTLVQNRIRIDRFTGGAMDNYLFSQAPVFAREDDGVILELVLRDPKRDRDENGKLKPSYEVGLLLLLLKDLWTGDLPLGGESSVGRGRLRGVAATLRQVTYDGTVMWKMGQQGEELRLTAEPEQADVWQSLEQFVAALDAQLTGR
ncbi:MAG: hypothetical protein JXA93_03575 [Anaerolineae bacterium]|nr:hypothetical protein [Anaerolineae bacterium]